MKHHHTTKPAGHANSITEICPLIMPSKQYVLIHCELPRVGRPDLKAFKRTSGWLTFLLLVYASPYQPCLSSFLLSVYFPFAFTWILHSLLCPLPLSYPKYIHCHSSPSSSSSSTKKKKKISMTFRHQCLWP